MWMDHSCPDKWFTVLEENWFGCIFEWTDERSRLYSLPIVEYFHKSKCWTAALGGELY